MAQAQQQLGFPVQIDSGYRTPEEQQALQSTGLAAPVGHSLHESGNAVDINWNALNPQQQEAFKQYMLSKGYRWGQSFGEPWHFDLGNAPATTPTQPIPTTPAPQVVPVQQPGVSTPTPSGFELLDQMGVQ